MTAADTIVSIHGHRTPLRMSGFEHWTHADAVAKGQRGWENRF